ncbi:MAG: imidazole glycerol phosphate synthase subunit HisH [Pseudolysinimonas sp.]|uniref:imidazole glycerol phosphate synthase subunit HisH n=1 Tax=Pseudolysinimonas sp. TaxID=2680009 RepID=UPI003265400A
MTVDITIVDYGVGNVASIANMIRKTGLSSELSADADVISAAERIILPGVGAFDTAASRLRLSGLGEVVAAKAAAGDRVLGVCLGMQLLLDGSEEGDEPGLGIVPGTVRRFPRTVGEEALRVPHMGWNTVTRQGNADVLPAVLDGDRFYFVHSYYADPSDSSDTMAITDYGVPFASMIRRGNVVGAQFHPEKSHRMGARLLADFGRS